MSYELVAWKPAAWHTGYRAHVQLEDSKRHCEPTIASLMAFSASSLPRMSSTFTSLCSFCNSKDVEIDPRLPIHDAPCTSQSSGQAVCSLGWH